MKKPDPILFELQDLVVDLALVQRNHHLAGQPEPENDIVHSFAVAMLCWYLHDKHASELNLERILKYALVHDFPERYAGDTNTYASKADRQKKVELEKTATVRLGKEFANFNELVQTLQEYESLEDDEALFVWTVDKMQALVLADMDGWRPYQKIGITYDRFVTKHSEQLAMSSKYCEPVFQSLLEYCKTTFYDRP